MRQNQILYDRNYYQLFAIPRRDDVLERLRFVVPKPRATVVLGKGGKRGLLVRITINSRAICTDALW